jgi:hypothetical protein
MNPTSAFTLRSWLSLLLFEFAGLGLCLALGRLSVLVIPFHNPEIARAAMPYIAGALAFFWIVLSLLALREHRSGISVSFQIIASAVIGAPLAAVMFVFLFEHRHEGVTGWSLVGSVTFFALIAAAVSLLLGVYIVDIAKWLGDRWWKLFTVLGF